jgi:hypothetical protein
MKCCTQLLGAVGAGWLLMGCAASGPTDAEQLAARAEARSSNGHRYAFSLTDDGESAIPFCIDFYAELTDAQIADIRKDPELEATPCDDEDVVGVCDLPTKASSVDLYPQAIFYPVMDPSLKGKSLDLAKMVCTKQMGKFSNTPHPR